MELIQHYAFNIFLFRWFSSYSPSRIRCIRVHHITRKLIIAILLLTANQSRAIHPYPQVSRTRQVVSFTTVVLSRLGSPPSAPSPFHSPSLPTGHHPLLPSLSPPPPSLPVSLYGSVAPITPAAAKCDPLRVMECANYNIC